ncbi:MAG: NADPH-dependent F420 reductase [Thermoleophilia bacterium]
MTIAILGTGNVARALVPALAAAGRTVIVASRTPSDRDLVAWAGEQPGTVTVASHEDAVGQATIVVNALPGTASLAALTAIAGTLAGRVLIDVANAVTFGSSGAELIYQGASLGAELQRALPGTRVVKTLNTLTAEAMVAPAALSPHPSVFLSGDDPAAKEAASALLADLGWPPRSIVDLGGIDTARGPENAFHLLLSLMSAAGTREVSLAVAR